MIYACLVFASVRSCVINVYASGKGWVVWYDILHVSTAAVVEGLLGLYEAVFLEIIVTLIFEKSLLKSTSSTHWA